jgi:hypothetical protein
MSRDAIRKVAPAVFATRASFATTQRYNFFSTEQALDVLEDAGYVVVRAQQDKARLRDPRFVRHALTLRHADEVAMTKVGDTIAEIILVNSHNTRTKLTLRAGLFRLICSNGMVVGDPAVSEAISHAGTAAAEVLDRVRKAAALTHKVNATVEAWKNIELTESRQIDFAKAAAELRFGERAASYEPVQLLQLRRPEDEGRSLWRVFNRVQENTVARSLIGMNALNRAVQSRPLTDIGSRVKYNEELWQLAETFAS